MGACYRHTCFCCKRNGPALSDNVREPRLAPSFEDFLEVVNQDLTAAVLTSNGTVLDGELTLETL